MQGVALIFPGQGAQRKGMGRALFARHSRLVRSADEILGYSLARVTETDDVDLTQYTQPALFVVNALNSMEWLDASGRSPQFAAGHSLGEYNALHAAGAFDFETGLELVAARGRLMSECRPGKMAAVVGWKAERLQEALDMIGDPDVEIVNYNSPTQQVIAGQGPAVDSVVSRLRAMDARVVELRVTGAFHSKWMQDAASRFARSLSETVFKPLAFPVISNVEAKAYIRGREAELLAKQISAPVRWTASVDELLRLGTTEFVELGPTPTLAKLVEQTKAEYVERQRNDACRDPVVQGGGAVAQSAAQRLGCEAFRKRYAVRYAYVAGAMYKGIASGRMVVRMARAGMLAFLGTGGLKISRIEDEIAAIQAALKPEETWGANLLANLERPELEEQTVDVYLRRGVKVVEAAAYTQISRALVRYRVCGLSPEGDGVVGIGNRVIAKVSRPEVARAFLSPPPVEIVSELLREGAISAAQASAAARVPMADDLCIESDSGGHTDGGVALVLLPRIRRLRDEFQAKYRYAVPVGTGAAGGIGTPEAAAAAFLLGADFVLTGSINQCTVEAGTSDAVKDILMRVDVQDVAYAPAGDMFEVGAKIQVVRKGTLFPARANRLYGLYMHYDAIESLPAEIRKQIEEKYFCRSIDSVWEETRRYYEQSDPRVIQAAEDSPKKKMALVFRWYFVHTNRMALSGDQKRRNDFQIHCGPALGAFNAWAAERGLSDWRNRHVDRIGLMLMRETAEYLDASLARAGESRGIQNSSPLSRIDVAAFA
jgi:trans-AT polyketide synthase/acyltransferase/oxidoreductase domain-containing protein